MASKLMGDFYTIAAQTRSEGKLNAVLRLNVSHPIFTGHFPGQPVVPGACLLQMTREILEAELSQTMHLSVAHNLKFIAPVDPGKNGEISFELLYQQKEEGCIVSAAFFYDDKACCKFNGVFVTDSRISTD